MLETDKLTFVVKIITTEKQVYCFSAKETTLYYEGVLAVHCLDFQNVRDSLISFDDNSTNITFFNFDDKINVFDAKIEILLVEVNENLSAKKIYSILYGMIIAKINVADTTKLKIMPMINKLNRGLGEFYSELCRADFCDSKCGLNIADFQHVSYVVEVFNNRILSIDISSNVTSGAYDNGIITFTKGDNAGFATRIVNQNNNTIYLLNIPQYNVSNGDECIISQGCDKRFETCAHRFKNIVNFRGEPFINSTILEKYTLPVSNNQSKNSGK